MKVGRRAPGLASANLQGRKPRDVWRGGASDAMGISTLAVCCRGTLSPCLASDRGGDEIRLADNDGQNRRSAAEIERHDGYRGQREGEHGRCRSRAGGADVQYLNVAANLN